ncbi:MAG: tRNA (adenosine(37)-N6)-threonylcarbamoyltransferase complex ATPase subunit type 1 TsaE [Geothermobacteraceae bacterium]
MPWTCLSQSEEQTEALGRRFGRCARPGDVLLLDGELGAGKTCFARGLARGLGVPDDVPVTSPSYTLLNQYSARLPLYHFDLYRLGEAEELGEIGFEECLYGAGVTLVEWSGRFPELRLEGVCVDIVPGAGASERQLTFSARGERARAWLERCRQQEDTTS